MAINFSKVVYFPAYNVFARPVTFSGGTAPTAARGIYNTVPVDVAAEDGTIFSEQRTVLDILEEEFMTLPAQGHHVTIPAHLDMPAVGTFEVIDADTNGGGETTLTLRRVVTTKP